MHYFWDTEETIPEGLGFSHFDLTHLIWLGITAAVLAAGFLWGRKMTDTQARRFRKSLALLILANELFKHISLLIGGNFSFGYLPLHLCNINIFLILIYAWKPSKMLGNFLYCICIPGALAAMLFPSWSSLPVWNAQHLHGFTFHIMLMLYPVVLLGGGRIRPEARQLPKCVLLLAGLAVIAFAANSFMDTNFMFLSHGKDTPLQWFEDAWGNHLYGLPILLAAVLAVMYLPWELCRILRKNK